MPNDNQSLEDESYEGGIDDIFFGLADDKVITEFLRQAEIILREKIDVDTLPEDKKQAQLNFLKKRASERLKDIRENEARLVLQEQLQEKRLKIHPRQPPIKYLFRTLRAENMDKEDFIKAPILYQAHDLLLSFLSRKHHAKYKTHGIPDLCFIQGKKGMGKTFMLNQVLSKLEQGINSEKKHIVSNIENYTDRDIDFEYDEETETENDEIPSETGKKTLVINMANVLHIRFDFRNNTK